MKIIINNAILLHCILLLCILDNDTVHCCCCQLAIAVFRSSCCVMCKQLRRTCYDAVRLTSWTAACWQCHKSQVKTTRRQRLKIIPDQDQFSCAIFHKEPRKTLCSCSLRAGEDATEDQSSLWSMTRHDRLPRLLLRTIRVSFWHFCWPFTAHRIPQHLNTSDT